MLPRGSRAEALKEQIVSDSMVMQNSDSSLALPLAAWDQGSPFASLGLSFLLDGMYDLEFHDSPSSPEDPCESQPGRVGRGPPRREKGGNKAGGSLVRHTRPR